jgi:hypothetical protein
MEGVIDKTGLIWPQLARLYENVAPYSYALIRFGAGAVIFYHGWNAPLTVDSLQVGN